MVSSDHGDPPELRAFHLTEDEERRVRDAFRMPDQLPKTLIVIRGTLISSNPCMFIDSGGELPHRIHKYFMILLLE